MSKLPDAPWIQDAENNGLPFDEEPPVCPVCGCSCREVYKDKFNTVCGCNICMEIQDAWEWMDEQREEKDYDQDDQF